MEFAESLCLNFKDVPGVSFSFYYFLGNVFKPRRQAAQDSDLERWEIKTKHSDSFSICCLKGIRSPPLERQSLEFRQKESRADRGRSSRETRRRVVLESSAQERLLRKHLHRELIDLTIHKVHLLRTGDHESQAKAILVPHNEVWKPQKAQTFSK